LVDDKAGWWLIVGGGLIAAGSFLPWISAATVFGTITQSGMDGDGMFTFAAGVAMGIVGGLLLSGNRTSRFAIVVVWSAIVLTTLVWIVDFQDIRNKIELVDSAFASGSVGYGIWLIAVGAVVSVAGAANLPTARGRAEPAEPL
jgi:hypothetical protein